MPADASLWLIFKVAVAVVAAVACVATVMALIAFAYEHLLHWWQTRHIPPLAPGVAEYLEADGNLRLATQLAERFNRLIASDESARDALAAVINTRVCGHWKSLRDHPTIQVSPVGAAMAEVGFLGVLNGAIGARSNSWGFLCAVLDDESGRLVEFRLTPAADGDPDFSVCPTVNSDAQKKPKESIVCSSSS